jgi:Membrane bound O-acyl transferase family
MFLYATALALGVLLSAAVLGYRLLCLPDSWLRHVLFALTLGAVLITPWALPGDATFARLCVGVVVCLCVVRLWESARRVVPAPAQASFWIYAYYFVTLPDTIFTTAPDERALARRRGLRRIARGLAKTVGLGGCFVLSSAWPALFDHALSKTAWCLLAAYLCCSAIVDVCAGINMALSGFDAVEVFNSPFLSRSPRDFWGRRWNMTFRNAAHRLIFLPLRQRHPGWAAAWVFIWSAAVHEYLIFAALQTSRGEMAAFFLSSGAVTLLETRYRRPVPLPRALAIALHSGWMLLVSPLFFAPLLRIMPVERWRLW